MVNVHCKSCFSPQNGAILNNTKQPTSESNASFISSSFSLPVCELLWEHCWILPGRVGGFHWPDAEENKAISEYWFNVLPYKPSGKASLRSVFTIMAFFTPDVFMGISYICSFEGTDINSYYVKSGTARHC